MVATKEVALRKRQQIAKANRTMFLWVAGASVIIGVALVASLFLFQKARFNEKVLTEKSNTASILTENNKVVDELKNQVRVLNTNDDLKSVMVAGEDEPVQVILDALPADANSSAFGASLQKKFLTGNNLRLETLLVDPVQGVETDPNSSTQDASSDQAVGENQISFRFTVNADVDKAGALKDMLKRLERSIRPIDVTSLTLEAQGNQLSLKVEGVTSYEPAKTVELKNKSIKP